MHPINLLVTMAATAIAVFISAKMFSGIRVKSDGTLIVVAIVFGLLNAFVGPLVRILTTIVMIPAIIVTLGIALLFVGLVVNVVLLWITDKLIADFEIKRFGALFGTASVITIVGWLLRHVAL